MAGKTGLLGLRFPAVRNPPGSKPQSGSFDAGEPGWRQGRVEPDWAQETDFLGVPVQRLVDGEQKATLPKGRLYQTFSIPSR